MAELQARLFELLPNPPLATRQLDLLKADNVASGYPAGLRKLNIQPKAVEEIVPTYLGRSWRRLAHGPRTRPARRPDPENL